MIDTHAHIDTEQFDNDRQEMLQRAFDNGIEYIIIPAIEPNGFEKLLTVTNSCTQLFCGLGIHPHNALEVNEEILEKIEELAVINKDKVIAIGEIGIDYHYDFAPKEVQKETFRTQLKLAKKLNLPVIVHNRESDEDLLSILESEQDGTLRGVLHCFSGSLDSLRRTLELNFHVSFTGNITFKNNKLLEQVLSSPIDKILLETDSPYMKPVPIKEKRNEPMNVRLVAEKISEIKSIQINEVIKMTTQNAKKLFKLTVFLLFTFFSYSIAYAQANEDTTVTVFHPYEKHLGFSPVIGINTVVTTFYYPNGTNTSPSYEGIPFYGGSISYSVFDFLLLEGSYFYDKNMKVYTANKGAQGPHINQFVEISSQWIANPYARVMFFATGGLSFLFNTFDELQTFKHSKNTIGFNIGIGFKINIPIKGFGLLNPFAEWRLNWDPAKTDATLPDGHGGTQTGLKQNAFYSMPRFGIMVYPNIFKF